MCTIWTLSPRDGAYPEITFIKYDQCCPKIFGVIIKCKEYSFSHFLHEIERKCALHQKSPPACVIT